MYLRISTAGAIGFAVALSLGAATSGVAQSDTAAARRATRSDSTKRATTTHRRRAADRAGMTSSRRIPVSKDVGMRADTSRKTSTGEVASNIVAVTVFDAEKARVDSMFLADHSRLDDLGKQVTDVSARVNDVSTRVNGVNDQVTGVRRDVDALRTSQMALADSLRLLRQRFNAMRNRSLFNNSGFFVGLGVGANFPNGTLSNIGYDQGLHIEVPIGYRKPGSLLGVQLDLGVQTLDGLNRSMVASNGTTFTSDNPDPRMYSAIGAVTLNFPLGQNHHNEFYLIGGGGLYHFTGYGSQSTLAAQLGEDVISSGTNTSGSTNKWGVTGGAGLQFGLVGPSSIFIESRFTNVFTTRNSNTTLVAGDAGNNLRWVPLMLGISLH